MATKTTWRKRVTTTRKRATKTRESLRKLGSVVAERTTHQQCSRCDPPRMVPLGDWSVHQENFHKPGGYEYELRKLRDQQARSRRQNPAPPPQPPPRPERPKNTAKVGQKRPAPDKETLVSQNNGTAPTPAADRQMTTTAPEGIAEAFRLWAMLVPPSIPASRLDAQAMADAYRQMADSVRLRIRLEMEQNNLPEQCLEPYQQAANLISQIGDLHMEAVRRVEIRYAEIAEILSRPDTPNAEYLQGGR